MGAGKDEAVSWQKAMIKGESSPALDRCITCFSCNERCPQGANPFDLHASLQEKFRKPFPSAVVDSFEAHYNFTGTLKEVPKAKRVMSACMYDKSHADIMQGRLYDLPVVGGKPFFCWGLFSHFGAGKTQKEHGLDLVNRLAMTGAEEVVCFHVDCYSMLATTLPDMGIDVPFRPVHLAEHLVEVLKANRQAIKPLNIAIAYQRPCASKHNPEMESVIDELFSLAGAERVKRTYDRGNSLCCSSLNLLFNRGDGQAEREKNILDAKEAGARCLVYFCPVCKDTLADTAARHGLPMVFLGDIARMAIGEIEQPV